MVPIEERLSALADAASALAGELDLDEALQTIVRSAADLTGARYAALGVLGDDESIERFITHGADDETIAAIGRYPTGRGLLGLLIRDPQILRLEDLHQHPASAGFPPHHPEMVSFLGAPVRSGGRVFGNLYLTEKAGGFDEVDEHLISVLAAQAGAAVETAQLHARLRDVAVQDERDRIARELHDGVIQSLFSIGMGVESARSLLSDAETIPKVDQRLDEAVTGLDTAIRELRAAIFRLRPQRHASGGLAAGLADLAREYEANALLRPELSVPIDVDVNVPSWAVADALAVVREALSNVARHAHAESVGIRAELHDGTLEIGVADDGKGFTETAQVGHGLTNMCERAAALGGTLDVDGQLGQGTVVRLRIPLDAEEERR